MKNTSVDWRRFFDWRRINLGRRGVDESTPKQQLDIFSSFVNDKASLNFVASHIKREFPRLSCGFVYFDLSSGKFGAAAVPNDSPTPTETWLCEARSQLAFYLKGANRDWVYLGAFSNRAPGKSATPEAIRTVGRGMDGPYWVFAINEHGSVTEAAAWAFEWSERVRRGPSVSRLSRAC